MLKKNFIFCCLYFSLSVPTASASGLAGSGLEISLAGDMVFGQGLNDQSQAPDRLSMRGAEMMFYAPTDHQFDGVLSAAAHDEAGQTVFELHELYVQSRNLLPLPQTEIKIGQFFLGLGRLNRFHQHDWPFTEAPIVHQSFFAREAVFDSGVEFQSLLTPSENFHLNLTAGLTNGYRYGHSHSAGQKPKAPTHYLRLSHFLPLTLWGQATDGLEVGLNYLGRKDFLHQRMQLTGVDLVLKRREGKMLRYLLQSEFWHKREHQTKKLIGQAQEQIGAYLFQDFALNSSTQSSLGLRLDGFKDLSKRHALTQKKMNNMTYAVAPQWTYHSSEFAKLRTTLSHQFTREEGVTMNPDTRFLVQVIFILGSHPAHEF